MTNHNHHDQHDQAQETEYKPNNTLFETGKHFPPKDDLKRLADYEIGKRLYDGEFKHLPKRAQQMLKDTPHAERLNSLYLAVNLLDIIVQKPADLMFNEDPTFESGQAPESIEQTRLAAIVEENDLTSLGQELVVGAGFRGDSFIKTYFSYRQDFSELPYIPKGVKMESIIESQDPATVFPELARGSKKKFKAINIAAIEWVIQQDGSEIPYLNVERHVAGWIHYRRFRLSSKPNIITRYGVNQEQFEIMEEVHSDFRVVETGVPMILVRHIPYKAVDTDWKGISTTKKIKSLIYAINDRLTQIDYILMKHSDPTAYGVDLQEVNLSWGGRYIPLRDGEVAPAYMTWDGKLTDAFKQLETMINLVFQLAETPQWLFGTTIGNAGGTGTSHTDGSAIKARFMPILSKVKRVRTNVDRALRDSLYCAQLLENVANEGEGFQYYDAVYPKIRWRDGLPANEKEQAEVMAIRTGNLPTIDRHTAIKDMDGLDDAQAQAMIDRIKEDEKALKPVTPNVFNEEIDLELEEEKEDEKVNG
ncbi:phage portal protein [Bacillus thuringiensis]|uniref:phage portal protein n=1 Tax=Bacillus thuringiensis TaxID=1428 RepID=UPI000BED8DAE|nr:phage portal protein [Bacillus thuringiensis]PEE67682.1 portal protein [Bacillus thuringiensis]